MSPSNGPLSGITILLVEDQDMVRRAIARMLIRDGAQVTEACTGADMRRLVHEGIDLIVMDQDLPDASGVELLRWLREEDLPPIPVLAITGDSSPHFIDEVILAGADDFLAKPMDQSLLRHRLLLLRRLGISERRLVQSWSSAPPRPPGEPMARATPMDLQAALLYVDTEPLHHLEQESPPLEQLLGQLHQTIADSIRHHSGRVLRHGAEGVLAVFQGPQACLRACEASTLLHRRLSDERALSSWGRVGVGVGLHAGLFQQADILPRQTELIGAAATIPRRLAEAARAGETLCSAVACELANQLWYGESREVLLRGAHRAVVGRPLLTW